MAELWADPDPFKFQDRIHPIGPCISDGFHFTNVTIQARKIELEKFTSWTQIFTPCLAAFCQETSGLIRHCRKHEFVKTGRPSTIVKEVLLLGHILFWPHYTPNHDHIQLKEFKRTKSQSKIHKPYSKTSDLSTFCHIHKCRLSKLGSVSSFLLAH